MAIDYKALQTECLTNPNGYSDAASGLTLTQAYNAGADALCATILNRVRNTINISRSDIAREEIVEAIDTRDLSASANVLQGSWFESFTQGASPVALLKPNATNTRMLDNLLRIMGNQNNSETRLRALAVRNGSRAEQLFGEGTVLTASDILQARSA